MYEKGGEFNGNHLGERALLDGKEREREGERIRKTESAGGGKTKRKEGQEERKYLRASAEIEGRGS